MFKTFQGNIDTKDFSFFKKADDLSMSPIDLKKELFTFSENQIMFTPEQNKTLAHTILFTVTPSQMDTYDFKDGTKYELRRLNVRGNKEYEIKLFGFRMPLKLNWINRQKIEWVHGKKINWTKVGAVAVILTLLYYIITYVIDHVISIPKH